MNTESVSVINSQGRKKIKSPKRKLYELHTWVGFHLAFLMSVVLLTGTIAVIADEIDWLIQAEMRVVADDERVSWGEMETAVRLSAPDHLLASITAGEGDYMAYRASMVRSDGKRYFIHINQWTGAISAAKSALTVQRFFRDLHRYLFMPSVIGLPIVCSLAIVLIISLYSGLKTAGRIRTVAMRVRTNRGARVVIGDLHRAAGVWSMWFLVVIVVTGIWYMAEFGAAVAGERFEPDRPELTERRVLEIGDSRVSLSADDLIEKAKAAFPGWVPRQILFPVNAHQAVTVLGRSGDFLVRSRANRVFLDPVDGSVIKVQKSDNIGVVAYLNEIADPLHFGSFGFLASKSVWFIFGVVLTGLSITGVWLTYKRLKSVTISRTQLYTLPILLGAMICGWFYVDRYIGSQSESVVVAEVAKEILGFSLTAVWREAQYSEDQSVDVILTHSEGSPMPREGWVISGSGERYAMSYIVATSRTIMKVTIPTENSDNWESLAVDIELISGLHLQQALSRNDYD